MSIMKPIYSPDIRLDHNKRKTIEVLGFRWIVIGQKWMSLNGEGDGKISFDLLRCANLPDQFKCKMQVRAFACKMDVPGKHEICTDSDRRFTNIVEKIRFFDKDYDLIETDLDRQFNIDFNTVDKYKEQTKDENFSPIVDVEVFVRISIVPTEKTWGYLKEEFEDRIDLESPEQSHDRILKVGEKKFYVQSQLLTVLSGYFKKLFEKPNGLIKIKNVDPEIFHDMLKMMYQSEKVIGALNAVPLYKMAAAFKCRCVFDVCSEYLSDSDNGALLHIIQYIKLADKYKDGKLLMAYFGCLRSAMGADQARGFVTAFQSKMRDLSMKTQTNLLYFLSTPDPIEMIRLAFEQMNPHHRH